MTLIEILVSLVVVAMTVSLFSNMGGLYQLNADARSSTKMTSFTRNYLDKLRVIWQDDNNYLNVALPQETNPNGYTYDITVAGTNTQTFVDVGTTKPAPVQDSNQIRTVSIVVKDSNGKVINTLSTLVRRAVIP